MPKVENGHILMFFSFHKFYLNPSCGFVIEWTFNYVTYLLFKLLLFTGETVVLWNVFIWVQNSPKVDIHEKKNIFSIFSGPPCNFGWSQKVMLGLNISVLWKYWVKRLNRGESLLIRAVHFPHLGCGKWAPEKFRALVRGIHNMKKIIFLIYLPVN